jgi:hypothetical protein
VLPALGAAIPLDHQQAGTMLDRDETDAHPRAILAEVDGNRTRQAERLGLTGFEDRGGHQVRGHLQEFFR